MERVKRLRRHRRRIVFNRFRHARSEAFLKRQKQQIRTDALQRQTGMQLLEQLITWACLVRRDTWVQSFYFPSSQPLLSILTLTSMKAGDRRGWGSRRGMYTLFPHNLFTLNSTINHKCETTWISTCLLWSLTSLYCPFNKDHLYCLFLPYVKWSLPRVTHNIHLIWTHGHCHGALQVAVWAWHTSL